MLTTQKQVRAAFWEAHHPTIFLRGPMRKRQNEYPADVRCAFVDYVDMLEKGGEISEALAQRVTL